MATITHLSEHEYRSLIVEYNDSAAPYPSEKTIVELFEAQVARTPKDEAIRRGSRSLSYSELNERANQMAAHLRTLGAGPERLVVLYMEHSIEVVCAILGVLKSGAGYVPVDPASTPKERLAFMLQDIAAGTGPVGVPPVLITQPGLVSSVPQDKAAVITLGSNFVEIEACPASNPTPEARPRNLAYVIYTSGSTGRPKGVLIEHGSLVNYIWWANQKYCQGERLTWPLFSSLAFDLTVTSIFTPLISGGSIVVYHEDTGRHGMAMLRVVEEGAVDIVKLTPSHLAMIKEMDLGGTRIRKLIVGGEDFKTELALDVTRKFGRPVEIYNEYGPTETTVGCMIHQYDPEKDSGPSVPIGIPAANTGVYILDEHLMPVAKGVTGEMYIAGDGLARGYLNRPELTEQKFLNGADPRQDGRAALLRLYKTGDLARWSTDGRMDFLGRSDFQVKINGLRIELGGIEARLLTHSAVSECVVDVTTGTNQLVAYYVSEKPLLVAEVRAHLGKDLPDYMVPPYIVWLEKLPLTSNGKVDRKALPIPSQENLPAANELVKPQTRTEQELAAVWAEVLHIEDVGTSDDFFDLGGNSLLAVKLMSRIRDEFGTTLPIAALFETSTLAGLANILDRETTGGLAAD
jgi:amino acid adenylation domain-containing protein